VLRGVLRWKTAGRLSPTSRLHRPERQDRRLPKDERAKTGKARTEEMSRETSKPKAEISTSGRVGNLPLFAESSAALGIFVSLIGAIFFHEQFVFVGCLRSAILLTLTAVRCFGCLSITRPRQWSWSCVRFGKTSQHCAESFIRLPGLVVCADSCIVVAIDPSANDCCRKSTGYRITGFFIIRGSVISASSVFSRSR